MPRRLVGLVPRGGGVGVAGPGPRGQWQIEPTCQPSPGLVSPSRPARGLAQAARHSLAPGTKCSAQRPPGFRDFEARQRGSAGGEAGGSRCRWGLPAANTNTASRFQPPSPGCPTFPLARRPPTPSRAAALARPRAAGRGQGRQLPLLGLRCQDPPEARLGVGPACRGGPSPPQGLPQSTRLVALGLGPTTPASFWRPLTLPLTGPPCPVSLLLPQALPEVHT